MKNRSIYAQMFPLIIFLISCSAQSDPLISNRDLSADQSARSILVRFFDSLLRGQYAEAANLYGGTYETMVAQNPRISSQDHAALFRNACTLNGMQCLPVKSVTLAEKISDTEFLFEVEFLREDGTLFVLGPCCGSAEDSVPTHQGFYFSVVAIDPNRFVVTDLPPYLP